ncbi:MAG TPA: SDR family NAD(P)-dependent oxidoreductase [Thermodesulfobacteriota bacterium]|nr:SDR family NAD(P)-dependent oxidoreductase [Thermodesulfobacteriota bacterium]
MAKVLVTGAGGFIGSHLTEELVRQGEEVRAFVRYNSRDDRGLLEELPKDIQSQIEVIPGDLKDPDGVRKAIKGCRRIFHLGALIAIPYSYIHPFDFIQTNVAGTAHLLNACLEEGTLERFIHTSTSEVYGTAQYIPIDEKHPLQAQSPYAASKIGADKLAESYNLSFGLPIATIRPFNTFGPRQSLRAIIPTIVSQAIQAKKIRLGNTRPRRDFLFVKDTVKGFIQVGKCEGAIGKVVNIGTGMDISIEELVKKVLDQMGKKVEIEVEDGRIRPEKSEVMQLLSDTHLAQELFQWAPRHTLEEGLRETIEWYQKNLSRFRVGSYPL